MATYLERYIIWRDSGLNPDDPAFVLPEDTSLPDVLAARVLIRRIESALVAVATAQLAQTLPGQIEQDQREAIYWAQAAISNAVSEARNVLQILLAKFSAQTPAEILDPVAVTDAALFSNISQIVRALALGRR